MRAEAFRQTAGGFKPIAAATQAAAGHALHAFLLAAVLLQCSERQRAEDCACVASSVAVKPDFEPKVAARSTIRQWCRAADPTTSTPPAQSGHTHLFCSGEQSFLLSKGICKYAVLSLKAQSCLHA